MALPHVPTALSRLVRVCVRGLQYDSFAALPLFATICAQKTPMTEVARYFRGSALLLLGAPQTLRLLPIQLVTGAFVWVVFSRGVPLRGYSLQ